MYGGYILSNLLMLNSKGDSFLLVDSDIMNQLITEKRYTPTSPFENIKSPRFFCS